MKKDNRTDDGLITPETFWHRIWEKKGNRELPATKEEIIHTLMEINAWRNSIGGTSVAMMQDTVERIRQLLDLHQNSSLLDIGCGSGLIYYCMDPRPASYTGVDYSASSIEIARQLDLEGTFHCGEAVNFPYTPGTFDGVLSLGVFFYFESYAYAHEALCKMVDAMKVGAKALILDVPDIATKAEREQLRQGDMSDEEYAERYKGLEHLYFSKHWFSEKLYQLNCSTTFVDFFGPEYTYDGLIFNVLFEKKAL